MSRSPMSVAEFDTYNRLADKMDFFHSILRSTWNQLYAATSPDSSHTLPSNIIKLGLGFCTHLAAHHDIEESTWYPLLATRMQGFGEGQFARAQHEQINRGLNALQNYLVGCRQNVRELKRHEVRNVMDSFSEVLWRHLDEEVEELGAETMRKYWSVDEMRNFPF